MSPPPPPALLEAIAQQPADDAPRLALADWYKEHGDEAHGLFVELQCRAARSPEGSPERAEAAAGARRLLEEAGETWALPVPGVPALRFRFDRGVPDAVEGDLASAGACADQLAGAPSLVRRLAVHAADAAGPMERLAASEFFGRVRALSLECRGSAGLDALLASGQLGRLESLALRCRDVALDTWARLDERAGLDALLALDLGTCNAGPWLRQLRHNGGLPALRSLGLSAVAPEAADLAALAESPLWARLRALDLSNCALSPQKATVLAGARGGQLEALGVAGTQLGPAGAKALLAWPLRTLRRVSLAAAGLTDACLPALLDAPCLADVEHLDLRANAFTAQAAQALRARYGAVLVL